MSKSKENSWDKVEFSSICKNVSLRINDPKKSGYERYVGLEHLDTLEPSVTKWGSTADVESSMTIFKKGQILFGRRNWYLRRVSIPKFDGICSADIYVLEEIRGNVIKDFLPIFMHSDQFFEKTMMYSVGSMSTRVKWNNLSKINFFIPSKANQEKLVSIIRNVDETIINTNHLMEKTTSYLRSKSNELFTNGFHHTKFKKEKTYFDKIISIPSNWKKRTLSELGNLNAGGTPSTVIKEYWEKGKIPWLSSGEIRNNRINSSKEKITKLGLDSSSAYLFPKGTILIAITGRGPTRGRIAILDIDSTTNQSVVGIETSSDKVNNEFLFYLLQNKYWLLRGLSHGTQQPGLTLGILRSFHIFLPDELTEQKQITEILSKLTKQVECIKDYQIKLRNLRKMILKIKLTPPKNMEIDLIVQ